MRVNVSNSFHKRIGVDELWWYTSLETTVRLHCQLCRRSAAFDVSYKYADEDPVHNGIEPLCEPCLTDAIGWIRLVIWKKQCGL